MCLCSYSRSLGTACLCITAYPITTEDAVRSFQSHSTTQEECSGGTYSRWDTYSRSYVKNSLKAGSCSSRTFTSRPHHSWLATTFLPEESSTWLMATGQASLPICVMQKYCTMPARAEGRVAALPVSSTHPFMVPWRSNLIAINIP